MTDKPRKEETNERHPLMTSSYQTAVLQHASANMYQMGSLKPHKVFGGKLGGWSVRTGTYLKSEMIRLLLHTQTTHVLMHSCIPICG